MRKNLENLLQYCKVISLQLIKINEKKKPKNKKQNPSLHFIVNSEANLKKKYPFSMWNCIKMYVERKQV